MSVLPAIPSAELSRTLLDRVPSLLAYFDTSLRCRFANGAYAAQAGLDADDAVGRGMPELVGAEAFERRRPHVERVLAGAPQSFEHALGEGAQRRHLLINYVPDVAEAQVRGFVECHSHLTQLPALVLIAPACIVAADARRCGAQAASGVYDIGTTVQLAIESAAANRQRRGNRSVARDTIRHENAARRPVFFRDALRSGTEFGNDADRSMQRNTICLRNRLLGLDHQHVHFSSSHTACYRSLANMHARAGRHLWNGRLTEAGRA